MKPDNGGNGIIENDDDSRLLSNDDPSDFARSLFRAENLEVNGRRVISQPSALMAKIRATALCAALGTMGGNVACQSTIQNPSFAHTRQQSEWGSTVPSDKEIEERLMVNFRQTNLLKGIFNWTETFHDIQRIRSIRRQNLSDNPDVRYHPPSLEGLEIFGDKIDINLLTVFIKKFIRDGFPQGWVSRATMNTIIFRPLSGNSNELDNIYESEHLDGLTIHYPFGGTEIVLDTNGEKERQEDFMVLMDTLPHEVMHNNAASNSPFLSGHEANRLLYIFLNQLYSPRRPYFPYVEKLIQNSGNELTLEEFFSIESEFEAIVLQIALSESCCVDAHDWSSWKQIFSSILIQHYRAGAENARILVETVFHYLQKTDPDFKPWEAAKLRVQIKNEITRNWK